MSALLISVSFTYIKRTIMKIILVTTDFSEAEDHAADYEVGFVTRQ